MFDALLLLDQVLITERFQSLQISVRSLMFKLSSGVNWNEQTVDATWWVVNLCVLQTLSMTVCGGFFMSAGVRWRISVLGGSHQASSCCDHMVTAGRTRSDRPGEPEPQPGGGRGWLDRARRKRPCCWRSHCGGGRGGDVSVFFCSTI